MGSSVKFASIDGFLAELEAWIKTDVLTYSTLIQALVVGAALLFALLLYRYFSGRLHLGKPTGESATLADTLRRQAGALLFPVSWLVFLGIAALVMDSLRFQSGLIEIAVSLVLAWIVVRLVTSAIRNRLVARVIAIIAWTIAALHIVGVLDRAIGTLDSTAFKLGSVRISALTVVNTIVLLVVLIWVASLIASLIVRRVHASESLSPSIKVLVAQLFRILLIAIAALIAIDTVGIDLSALAVFGGALGVGLGFGLQKVVSNFVSGIILLLDKSIKPGDVIAVGDSYGWIKGLHARYVSVRTRDGTEILIPNDTLITEKVENWSFSDHLVRLKVPVGVAYSADVELAMKLCLEAAGEIERIRSDPKSSCLIRGFGDSSVDLEVRAWINDPENGRANVTSDLYLVIWRKFHEHEIEIPFPQRDLHIRSAEGLPKSVSAD